MSGRIVVRRKKRVVEEEESDSEVEVEVDIGVGESEEEEEEGDELDEEEEEEVDEEEGVELGEEEEEGEEADEEEGEEEEADFVYLVTKQPINPYGTYDKKTSLSGYHPMDLFEVLMAFASDEEEDAQAYSTLHNFEAYMDYAWEILPKEADEEKAKLMHEIIGIPNEKHGLELDPEMWKDTDCFEARKKFLKQGYKIVYKYFPQGWRKHLYKLGGGSTVITVPLFRKHT